MLLYFSRESLWILISVPITSNAFRTLKNAPLSISFLSKITHTCLPVQSFVLPTAIKTSIFSPGDSIPIREHGRRPNRAPGSTTLWNTFRKSESRDCSVRLGRERRGVYWRLSNRWPHFVVIGRYNKWKLRRTGLARGGDCFQSSG